jgi:peptide/nickel transport system permease protein
MLYYIIRRIFQSVLTVFGVMLITFILFRMIAGDVSTAYVNKKLGREARQAFYEKHKLNKPALFNVHGRMRILDMTTGHHITGIEDIHGARIARACNLHLKAGALPRGAGAAIESDAYAFLSVDDSLARLCASDARVQTHGGPAAAQPKDGAHGSHAPALRLQLSDGTVCSLDVPETATVGTLLERIRTHPALAGKVRAGITPWRPATLFDSQFFWHLYESITLSGKSYATDQAVRGILASRAKYSLSLTIPAMALTWFFSMIISCLVAYFRGSMIDRLGVFLSVLGLCIPYLAYIIGGQWIMFQLVPEATVGFSHNPWTLYAPISIAVVAGLGWSVRFYRTIILDQVNRAYVTTAAAKGLSLPAILFKHILKNSMLPILTHVIASIPFLILGALLLERFFGIPGLGDLMLSSITSRDVPVITGLTFFTSVMYVVSILVTDILYAVFDPRIRLR